MPWLLVVACSLGMLLGLLWMRVASIVAASVGLVVLCSAVAPLASWSLLTTLLYIFALVGALQSGYLVGGALSLARMTTRNRARIARQSAQIQRP
jgi:hypothetical protein